MNMNELLKADERKGISKKSQRRTILGGTQCPKVSVLEKIGSNWKLKRINDLCLGSWGTVESIKVLGVKIKENWVIVCTREF